MRGASKSAAVGACSTTWPAYITAMSSAWPAATPRSWVTRIMVMRCSRCSRRSRSRISACTVTSSAVVGSSAISSSGSQAIAIAITTRWRIPPESSCGSCRRRRSGEPMPTCASSATARASASWRVSRRCWRMPSASCTPIGRTGFSAVIGSWNTIAMRRPRTACMAVRSSRSRSRPSNRIRASGEVVAAGPSSRRIERESTDLPEPDSPTIARVRERATASETSSSACSVPRGVWNRTPSRLTWSRVSFIADLRARRRGAAAGCRRAGSGSAR